MSESIIVILYQLYYYYNDLYSTINLLCPDSINIPLCPQVYQHPIVYPSASTSHCVPKCINIPLCPQVHQHPIVSPKCFRNHWVPKCINIPLCPPRVSASHCVPKCSNIPLIPQVYQQLSVPESIISLVLKRGLKRSGVEMDDM